MAEIIAITASTPSLLSLNHLSTIFVTFPKFHDASVLQIIILSPLVMSSQYFLTFLLTTVSSFVSVWQLLATLPTLNLIFGWDVQWSWVGIPRLLSPSEAGSHSGLFGSNSLSALSSSSRTSLSSSDRGVGVAAVTLLRLVVLIAGTGRGSAAGRATVSLARIGRKERRT